MRVLLRVVRGPMSGRVFEFEEPDRFLFGRSDVARCALPDDPFVSSNHFLIAIAPPQVSLHELGSKNGTFVNDVRYGGRKPPAEGVQQSSERDVHLRHGDRIRVGETEIVVEVRSQQETDPLPHGDRDAGTDSAGRIPSFSDPLEDTGDDPLPSEGDDEDDRETVPPLREKRGSDDFGPVFAALPRYQPIRVLGQGGMGKVFLARDTELDREVAIKLIRPRRGASPAALDHFRRETDLTRQLSHPNVVRYLSGGHVGQHLYLVLEYVKGEDLAALYAREGPQLPLRQAGPLMVCALRGLGYAHQAELEAQVSEGGERKVRSFHGLVHRDLKPENILIADKARGVKVPKIADLGLAKVYGAAGLSDFTEPGVVAGTPYYWPREQLTDYRYLKPAADVFAMGTILYRLLSGHFPRAGLDKTGLSFHQVCLIVLRESVVPIQERLPKLPDGVAAVIAKSLEEEPQDRYPDAAAMSEALRKALAPRRNPKGS
jgi:eukaryotic-like serine/threonine-protein kinase